jgi:hypothetical protein
VADADLSTWRGGAPAGKQEHRRSATTPTKWRATGAHQKAEKAVAAAAARSGDHQQELGEAGLDAIYFSARAWAWARWKFASWDPDAESRSHQELTVAGELDAEHQGHRGDPISPVSASASDVLLLLLGAVPCRRHSDAPLPPAGNARLRHGTGLAAGACQGGGGRGHQLRPYAPRLLKLAIKKHQISVQERKFRSIAD